MASSATTRGKIRFWMFVARELWLKSAVRLQREYFELKRFIITKDPSLVKIVLFCVWRLRLLLGLGFNYIGRYSLLATTAPFRFGLGPPRNVSR